LPDWPNFPKGFFIRERKWKYYYSTFYKRDLCLEKEAAPMTYKTRLLLKCFAKKKMGPVNLAEAPVSESGDTILTFSRPKPPDWPKLCFSDFKGKHQFLGKKIRNITQPVLIGKVDSVNEVPIGIHVRTEYNIGGELEWFVKTLNFIRKQVGYPIHAYIGTDAKAHEIRPLLDLGNTTLLRGPAIVDMLILSKSKLFLASGHSSFSAWISFLGQMPSFCNPALKWLDQYPWEHLGVVNDKGYYLGPFCPDSPSDESIKAIQVGLTNPFQ